MPLIECEICGWEFGLYPGEEPGRTVCRLCPRERRVLEKQYAGLLAKLRAVVRGLGARVEFTNTGNDDFALEVRGLGLYPIIVATVAVPTAEGWKTRVAVPDPGQPWAVALFRDQTEWPHWPEIRKLPATDAEVVAFVREHRLALDVFAPGPRGGRPVCAACGCDPCIGATCLLTMEA
jgi:hypothetical protein